MQSAIDQGQLPTSPDGVLPRSEALRMPLQYLASLLTAGKEGPIRDALDKLLAMRSYQRSIHVEGKADTRALDRVGLSEQQAKDMYRLLAIANYEDRFVIPTGHAEVSLEDFYAFQGQNGFTFGNDSSPGIGGTSIFPERRRESVESLVPAPSADER